MVAKVEMVVTTVEVETGEDSDGGGDGGDRDR